MSSNRFRVPNKQIAGNKKREEEVGGAQTDARLCAKTQQMWAPCGRIIDSADVFGAAVDRWRVKFTDLPSSKF